MPDSPIQITEHPPINNLTVYKLSLNNLRAEWDHDPETRFEDLTDRALDDGAKLLEHGEFLTKKLDFKKKEYQELVQLHTALKRKETAWAVKHEALEKEDEKLKTKSLVSNVENEELKKEVRALRAEDQGSKAEKEALVKDFAILKKANELLISKEMAAQKAAGKWEETSEVWKKEHRMLKIVNQSLREEMEAVRADHTLSETNDQAIKQESRKLRTRNRVLDLENETLKKEAKALQKDNEILKSSNETLKKGNKATNDENRRIKAYVEELQKKEVMLASAAGQSNAGGLGVSDGSLTAEKITLESNLKHRLEHPHSVKANFTETSKRRRTSEEINEHSEELSVTRERGTESDSRWMVWRGNYDTGNT